MSPRNKEISEEMRQHSREALVSAARRLFASTGYASCRISDIAREAGMSQGNVYWYFSSKEELLKVVLAETFESLGAVMAQAAGGGTARQKVDTLLDGMLAFARQGSEFAAILITLMGHGNEGLFARLGFDMRQIGLEYTRSLLAILEQAQAEGLIPAGRDPQALAMMFFGLFNGLNLVYGQEWLALPPEVIKAGMLRLLDVQV